MSAIAKKEPRMVEVTSLPVIYVDGPGKVDVTGDNVRITYFEYRMVGSERVKMPVVEIVRPIQSCTPGLLQDLIKRAAGLDGSEQSH